MQSPPLLLYPGVPPVSAFSFPWQNASTVILDKITSIPYYWNPDTGSVTAFTGGGGGGVSDGDKGDIEVTASGATWTIDNTLLTAFGRTITAANNSSDLRALVGTFNSGNSGVVPASGGGTSDFLRADGTWTSPSAPPAVKTTTITLPYSTSRGVAVITDAAVSPGTNILVSWGSVSDTDENSPKMDEVSFFATPGSGQFTVTLFAPRAKLGGIFRLNYFLG